jgi:hypothetical protein
MFHIILTKEITEIISQTLLFIAFSIVYNFLLFYLINSLDLKIKTVSMTLQSDADFNNIIGLDNIKETSVKDVSFV